MGYNAVKRLVFLSSVVLIASFVAEVRGDIIGFTSFEESGLASTYSTNPFPNGDIGRSFNPGADDMELGFTTGFSDTRSTGLSGTLSGTDANDFAGVTNASVTNANNNIGPTPSGITGQNFFAVDDSDGRVELVFSVDTSGFTDTSISFDWAAALDTYESNDFLTLRAVDSDTDVLLFTAGETVLEGNGNTFKTETLNLSALGLTDAITLTFGFDVDAGTEDLFLDNLSVTGNLSAVPEPASIGILCALGGGFLVRRRYLSKKKTAVKSPPAD